MILIRKLLMISFVLSILIIASFPTSSIETKNIVNDKKELKMLYTLDDELNTFTVSISTNDYQQIEESFSTLSEYLRINMPKY